MARFNVLNPTGAPIPIVAGSVNQSVPPGVSVLDCDDTDAAAVSIALQATSCQFSLADVVVANTGSIAEAILKLVSNPPVGATFTVGASTYEIVAALGAAQAHVQVRQAGVVANTINRLVGAFNGTPDAANWVEALAPATEKIVALVATEPELPSSIIAQAADGRGGNPIVGRPSLALSATGLSAGDGWNTANLQKTGAAPGHYFCAKIEGITPPQVQQGFFCCSAPFKPTHQEITVRDANGVLKLTTSAVTPHGRRLVVSIGAGANTAPIVAGDSVMIEATD